MMRYRLSVILLLSLFAIVHLPVQAQATALTGTTEKTEEKKEEAPVDALGRSTPRGLVQGFLEAIANQDLEKAQQYLDLSDYSQARRQAQGTQLVQKFQLLLDRGGWFQPSAMLSDEATGHKDETDTEETQTDTIGSIRTTSKDIKITATLSRDDPANPVWLISTETLRDIANLSPSGIGSAPLVNKYIPESLMEMKWDGAPAGHWIASVLLLIASYAATWFFVAGIVALLRKCHFKRLQLTESRILSAVRGPISLYLAVWVFGFSSIWLGISILVRQHLGQLNVIVAWIAIALLAWRLVDIFAEAIQRRIIANGRFFGFSSIVFFFRRIIKVVFVVIIAFILLDNMGVDVTAGLAALGIGGIALALGAQKTLENFIGSLAIVIDQPIHVGDFCKIGDYSGTVEDIGMRSTRLRTNDRTLVTIPNGDLSNQTIENYARRRQFLLNKKFQLRYDATAEQLNSFIQKMEGILFSCGHIQPEGVPVRYQGPGSDGQFFEIFCHVDVSDFNEFARIQQDLMLRMTQLVNDLGLYFVIPSQTMLPAVDQRGKAFDPAAAKNPDQQ